MLLRSVTFENFGIYGGVHTFDLTPDTTGQFARPVVLFRGKNGVGKTTFVEGVRLCLHGPTALASRVGQQEYAIWLERHIHRAAAHSTAAPAAPTAVELRFDFTAAGKRVNYRVRRQWAVVNGRLQVELWVWENGAPLTALTPEERETLLREVAPPGLAEIFFFDGEKISALANDTSAQSLLVETVNALLGLNLVDQLQRDLDIYLARHGADGTRNGAHHELERAMQEQGALASRQADLERQTQACRAQHDALHRAIAEQEARIAAAGGAYASRRSDLLAAATRLDAEIEALRRQATELAGGLLPFAFAPQMLHAVRARLEVERTYHAQETARQLLARQEQVIHDLIGDAAFWADEAAQVALPVRERLLRQVVTSLRAATPGPAIATAEVILHVSDKEQAQLAHWIEQALDAAPLAFSRLIQAIDARQTERRAIDAELARAPEDATLAPLVATLHDLLRQSGALEQTLARLADAAHGVAYAVEQNELALRRARAALDQIAASAQRSQLAARTQQVLDQYRRALTQRKVALLEHSLVSHFNQLCRKHALLDRITIDPATLGMTLHRAGHTFTRDSLSAGENQLLAIALLWSLRELSGRATPVIIDTPLSRLDSEHRQSMLHDFLPHAGHQVIVLATDAEIDAAALKRLAPVIARIYRMEYDPTTGATTHTVETPAVVTPNLTLFDTVAH